MALCRGHCSALMHYFEKIKMQTLNVYNRLTHRFTLGWSGEDQWGDAVTLKALPSRLTMQSNDGESVRYIQRLIAPSDQRKADLSRAIADTMTFSNCRHEHDCCGCPSYYTSVRKVSAREYVARVNVSYNY